MKLEKVTFKSNGSILEKVEDANKPTKVEPEKLDDIDLGDQEAIAKREEQIKKIIAKRLEANKKVAEETKGEDHAILSKDIKVQEKLCKDRKEVGALVESLKAKGIKPFVKKVNEGENRYKVFYKPLKESDCDNVDIEALEFYVKNWNEGDNITVTADLLNVLEQSLEMYKKHCNEKLDEKLSKNEKIDLVNSIINVCEKYVEYVSTLGNENAHSDRILEDIISRVKELEGEHESQFKEDYISDVNASKAYWANEVKYQLENIEDLSQDERILNASEETINEMANRIAEKLLDDDHMWNEINDSIEWYIYHDEYMLENRKDESLNESDTSLNEEIISKEELKKVVDRYDLDSIMKGDLDSQDTEINEIILDCVDIVNKDGVEPFTSEWDELYAKVEPLVYAEIRSRGYKTESTSCSKKGARKLKEDLETQKQAAFENACDCLKYGYGKDKWNSCGLSKEDADEVWNKAFAEMSKEESKKPINKKISNPRKELIKEESHKGPFEIEYWVDEEARDMGFGDIYLERFDDLEEAKEVADSLFGEVASVEVLDANGQVVYGRYPEDESCNKETIKEDTNKEILSELKKAPIGYHGTIDSDWGDDLHIYKVSNNHILTVDDENACYYIDSISQFVKDLVGDIHFDESLTIDEIKSLFNNLKKNDYAYMSGGKLPQEITKLFSLKDESCSKKTIKEEAEVAMVEYCVMDELDNNIETFSEEEEAIEWAKANGGVRVLEVEYGPEDEYGDAPELSAFEIWALEDESLKEEDKPAPKSIGDCQKWIDYDMKHYGKISNNTNEIIKKAGFQIIKDDHGDYEVTAGKYEDLDKEKKFAKKVVKPGVQIDDDDMDAHISFNEAEAHAMIGDKPIVEDQKSEIEQANDFSSTMMNSDALQALEDDDNI